MNEHGIKNKQWKIAICAIHRAMKFQSLTVGSWGEVESYVKFFLVINDKIFYWKLVDILKSYAYLLSQSCQLRLIFLIIIAFDKLCCVSWDLNDNSKLFNKPTIIFSM